MLISLRIGDIIINLYAVFTLIFCIFLGYFVKKTPKIGIYYSSAISSWVGLLLLFIGFGLDFKLVQNFPTASFILLAIIAVLCITCIIIINYVKHNHLKYSGAKGKIYKTIPWLGITLFSIFEVLSAIIIPNF